MLHIALWEPEIPPNTGNIARSCAATGATLHLIGRLGFSLDDRALRRAGMDYWHHVKCQCHTSFEDFLAAVTVQRPNRLFCFSAHATRPYTEVSYQSEDVLLFGNESSGLPRSILNEYVDRTFRIPMLTGNVRSLNLATSVGIVLYEALRQQQVW